MQQDRSTLQKLLKNCLHLSAISTGAFSKVLQMVVAALLISRLIPAK